MLTNLTGSQKEDEIELGARYYGGYGTVLAAISYS
jgi:hypothetical protein